MPSGIPTGFRHNHKEGNCLTMREADFFARFFCVFFPRNFFLFVHVMEYSTVFQVLHFAVLYSMLSLNLQLGDYSMKNYVILVLHLSWALLSVGLILMSEKQAVLNVHLYLSDIIYGLGF